MTTNNEETHEAKIRRLLKVQRDLIEQKRQAQIRNDSTANDVNEIQTRIDYVNAEIQSATKAMRQQSE